MLEFLMSGSLLQTCLVGLVAGMVAYYFIKKRKYKLPPGPMALPLIGNLLQIKSKFLHEQIFYDWSKKYGPVVSVYLGPMLIVFVNDIDTAMEVLVKKSTDFASRMKTPSLDLFTQGGKDIVLAQYGPTWKLHRRIASKALRHYMQGKALEDRVHQAVETAFTEIEKRTSEPFDISEYINFMIGNILTGLCFGGKYEFNNKEIQDIIEAEDEFINGFNMLPIEDLIPPIRHVYKSKTFKQFEDISKRLLDDFMEKKFKKEADTFNRDNIRHFVDTLLLARLEAEEEEGSFALESLTETHLIQTVSDIFFAGLDTSRLTLRYAILHMVAYTDIQDKVQEELDRVVGRDQLPTLADRPDLGYTEAVLHESMRLSSVVPTGVFHMTTCDTSIAGHDVPKDTMVGINHWALHHDPDVWEDVDKFIPERFLDENGKMGPKPPNWLPFSAGKRVCLGEFVAKPELHLLFASLMQKFKWRLEPGTVADLTPEGSIFGITPKAYKVVAEKRT